MKLDSNQIGDLEDGFMPLSTLWTIYSDFCRWYEIEPIKEEFSKCADKIFRKYPKGYDKLFDGKRTKTLDGFIKICLDQSEPRRRDSRNYYRIFHEAGENARLLIAYLAYQDINQAHQIASKTIDRSLATSKRILKKFLGKI